MIEGVITKVMDRGYGFIQTEDIEQIFFHAKDLRGVEFEKVCVNYRVRIGRLEQGDRGFIAREVSPYLPLH